MPGYAAESWYGVFVPAKTQPATIALLNKAIDRSLRAPSFDKLVADEGLIMVGGAPEELGRYVHEQELLWRRVVREAGIKVE